MTKTTQNGLILIQETSLLAIETLYPDISFALSIKN